MYPITAAERVKREITAIGAINEFGRGINFVPKFITEATKTIYAEAINPLIIGFLLINKNSIGFYTLYNKCSTNISLKYLYGGVM